MRRNLASLGTVNLGICVLAGCALIAAATFATADSQPRRQARSTHLGVPPSDIVQLAWVGPTTSQKFVRLNADGTAATSEYAVPAGMRLVVTDADWVSATQGGNQQTLRIWVENKASSTTRQLVCTRSTKYYSTSSPVPAEEHALVTGFTVASGGRLVVDQAQTNNIVAQSYGTSTAITAAILLRGYVVVDE